jgi:GTPase SAR1 family protein
MDGAKKRLLVMGPDGVGKSALLNILGGHKLIYNPDDEDHEIHWAEKPVFLSEGTGKAVTQEVSYSNLSWAGSEGETFVGVDSVGHDVFMAADHDRAAKATVDLNAKLKAMGHVHCILVLCPDDGGRLNTVPTDTFSMLDYMFNGGPVWSNVVVATVKIKKTKKQVSDFKNEIKEKVPSFDTEVPILHLGGTIKNREESVNMSDETGFGKLKTFIDKASPLCTMNVEKYIAKANLDTIFAEKRERCRLFMFAFFYVLSMLLLNLVSLKSWILTMICMCSSVVCCLYPLFMYGYKHVCAVLGDIRSHYLSPPMKACMVGAKHLYAKCFFSHEHQD